MNLYLVLRRLGINFVKDLPITPHKVRAGYRCWRGARARRLHQLERIDRIRNPSKYLGK